MFGHPGGADSVHKVVYSRCAPTGQQRDGPPDPLRRRGSRSAGGADPRGGLRAGGLPGRRGGPGRGSSGHLRPSARVRAQSAPEPDAVHAGARRGHPGAARRPRHRAGVGDRRQRGRDGADGPRRRPPRSPRPRGAPRARARPPRARGARAHHRPRARLRRGGVRRGGRQHHRLDPRRPGHLGRSGYRRADGGAAARRGGLRRGPALRRVRPVGRRAGAPARGAVGGGVGRCAQRARAA